MIEGAKFAVGDKIRKPKGYSFDGTVVSVFKNTKGEIRIVAELDGDLNGGGMLHIFSEQQLELRTHGRDSNLSCYARLY